MSFLHPALLLLLLPLGALVAGYVHLQRRRRHYAVRFTNVELLQSVAPRRPGWRRHVPAAGVGLALVAAVVGLAQPVHATEVPRESAVVMLAIDVSGSMAATDVGPDRLTAAVTAASSFVEQLPDGFEVGLVTFDKTAHIAVQATDEHETVIAALQQLQLGEGTAAGEGLVAALDAIEAAQAAAGATATFDGNVAAGAADETEAAATATVVLLSDGATTSGLPVAEAAALAADAGVPVSTITFGTDAGSVTVGGRTVSVPPDAASMQQVAEITGGTAFDAASSDELSAVYDEIQGRVGYLTEDSPLMVWFLGAAVALLTAAVIGSLVWTGRFL